MQVCGDGNDIWTSEPRDKCNDCDMERAYSRGQVRSTRRLGFDLKDRFASTKELGDFIMLLCSERAGGFMTGSDVIWDGGE